LSGDLGDSDMEHEKLRELISTYFDGELDAGRKRLVEDHIKTCPECKREFDEMVRFEEVMGKMALKKPPEEAWKTYWSSVYNRMERQIGWILFSIGAMIILFFAGYHLFRGIIEDVNTPLILKVGILAVMGGLVVLFVSVLRERIFVNKRERYKDIEK
jgi:predicted anti-sigma-YlaC factor YlaD